LIVARLRALLGLLALLVMPFAMQSGAAAAAPPRSHIMVSMSHCAEGALGKPKPMSRSECMTACAMLPAFHPALASPRKPARLVVAALPSSGLTGIEAEAETPPPRS